jgi:hypothetical protein
MKDRQVSASYIPTGHTQSACKGCGGKGGDVNCVCRGRGYFNNPSRVYRRVDAQVAESRRALGFMSTKQNYQDEKARILSKLKGNS